MKVRYLPFFAMLAFAFASCDSGEPETPLAEKIELTRSEATALNAINDFSFDVLKATDEIIGSVQPNYAFSPQTYAWTLAMIANGATEGSLAEKELIETLNLNDEININDVNDYASKLIAALRKSDEFSRLSISNAVFYKNQINLKETYLDILRTYYNVKEFKDHSSAAIDAWISSETGGMINDFAESNNLDYHDFGVISNLCFEGIWANPFDPADTQDLDFRNADGTISKVPTMSKKSMLVERGETDFCHLARLEFRGFMYSINFIIPAEGLSIDDVIKKIDRDSWEKMTYLMRFNPNNHVRIPRFETRCDINFVNISKKLGIKEVFENPASMLKASEETLNIVDASQSTYIKIDETGVKAASTSQISSEPTSAGFGFFYLDEPFIYIISELTTGAILFMGKVSQL